MGHLTHGGVYIHIYQVDDPAIAQKIIDRVREKHKSIPNVAVRVFVYGSKHGESKLITAEAKVG